MAQLLIASLKLDLGQQNEQTRLLENPANIKLSGCSVFIVNGTNVIHYSEKGKAVVVAVDAPQDLLKSKEDTVLVKEGIVLVANVASRNSFAWQVSRDMWKPFDLGFAFCYKGENYCFAHEPHEFLDNVLIYEAVDGISENDARILLLRLAEEHYDSLVLLDVKGALMLGAASYIQKPRHIPVILGTHACDAYMRTSTSVSGSILSKISSNTADFIKEYHLEGDWGFSLMMMQTASFLLNE